ncbi:MAG: DUF4835 family protein [Flavobacteriaceae bacterium]
MITFEKKDKIKHMKKWMLLLIFIIGLVSINGQELNCKVNVISSQVSGSNKQVFTTLEKAVNEFMNNTKWTDKNYKNQEKVQCVMTLNISERISNDTYKGSLQVQVVRPVFNSTYLTPILNYSDNDILFNYEEFQPLEFNKTSFDSNLTSLLSFYAYVMLGIDADSFSRNGGDEHLKEAEKIMLLAQQGGAKGWNSIDGDTTRFKLIDGLLDPNYKSFRLMMYKYHLSGLDTMVSNKTNAKKNISNAIILLKQIYSKRPNAYLLRVFLDTKTDEIVSIFSDGPKINSQRLRETLMKIFPTKNSEWSKID